MRILIHLFFAFLFCWNFQLKAQAPEVLTSAEIHHAIKKLKVVGSVMCIAAHPDDENNGLLTWLATDQKLNTAYLSLTRGDGGQNLIGTEIRELLGILRTQEMLMARKIDGSQQFFTRANDFGYSKNPEETFTIWDRDSLLSDMVWLIRKFQPDVLITRFPHIPVETHGHHTASAQLAYDAFDAAGDPARFPDQLDEVSPWQPTRLMLNSSPGFYKNDAAFEKAVEEDLLAVETGTWYPHLGLSNAEVAADSRSQHKCQGMGTAGSRGSDIEYFQHLKGKKASNDLFDGIDLSWNRLHGGRTVAKKLNKIEASFDTEKPWKSVDGLLDLRQMLVNFDNANWREVKISEIDQIIYHCLGLFLEVTSNDFSQTAGQQVTLSAEMINRSPLDIKLARIEYSGIELDSELVNPNLPSNQVIKFERSGRLADLPYARPYWLREKGSVGFYSISSRHDIGKPENTEDVKARFWLNIRGVVIPFEVPIVFKALDFVKGEHYLPFEIQPPVTINLSDNILVFAKDEPKTVQAVIKSGADALNGVLRIEVPSGWTTEPTNIYYDLKKKGDEKVVDIHISPGNEEIVGELRIWLANEPAQQRVEITYDHIPTQLLFLDAKAKIVRLDLKKQGEKIGYIMGAGDVLPESLEQVGYQVKLLEDAEVDLNTLQKFDAVIVGVRAYNTRERIKFHQPVLMDYVQKGGTLIVQYNTVNKYSKLVTDQLGPYPLELSTDRVTSENSKVNILDPDHPVFKGPNKITSRDFDGWVQERGLYFPGKWDEKYQTVIACHDPGEEDLESGLLIAKYGEGYYVYTGYSWFRQLPAGVPGAFRLFTNLISLGKEDQ